jgi:hypothetical protein
VPVLRPERLDGATGFLVRPGACGTSAGLDGELDRVRRSTVLGGRRRQIRLSAGDFAAAARISGYLIQSHADRVCGLPVACLALSWLLCHDRIPLRSIGVRLPR